jgi:hypothetical protein
MLALLWERMFAETLFFDRAARQIGGKAPDLMRAPLRLPLPVGERVGVRGLQD